MFKDLPEGQTHYVGDSCKPRHKLVRDGNIKMDEDGVIVVRNWEKEFKILWLSITKDDESAWRKESVEKIVEFIRNIVEQKLK